eukprot:CAMPEP_0117433304 /NCGR_PEP_ID=MMETSP0758-20121206/12688_1 /TAXON_ID=63605 /ORGANISM="Percolomonas cosmopolitus, Strain AE-1 (ATCC 50343)" /LENGTH=478 /DNA_ID=CAMNT_0005223879 /DNA_START=588 /DNA_END=2024 /DNA_ORIENTATION=+
MRQKTERNLSPQLIQSTFLLINTKIRSSLDSDELTLIEKEEKEEENDLQRIQKENTPLSENEFSERQSGSMEWRKQRQEAGGNKKLIQYDIKPLNQNEWKLYDCARFDKGGIQLTENKISQRGGAFYKKWINCSKFSIEFFISIFPRGADGMALILTSSPSINLGTGGNGKGYDSMKSAIAIEFDTYSSPPNHIAVHIPDNDGVLRHGQYPLQKSFPHDLLNDGSKKKVVLSYENGKLSFSMGLNSFTINLDIKNILKSDQCQIGFTAATGGISQNHFIWVNAMNVQSPSTEKDTMVDTLFKKSFSNEKLTQLNTKLLEMDIKCSNLKELKVYLNKLEDDECVYVLRYFLKNHSQHLSAIYNEDPQFLLATLRRKVLPLLHAIFLSTIAAADTKAFTSYLLSHVLIQEDISDLIPILFPYIASLIDQDLSSSSLNEEQKNRVCSFIRRHYSKSVDKIEPITTKMMNDDYYKNHLELKP